MRVRGLIPAGVLLLLAQLASAQPDLERLIDEADTLRRKPTRENLERARELLLKASSSKPEHPKLTAKAFYRLGQVYQTLREHEQALAALSEARRRFDANQPEMAPFALHNIAACHLALGDPATAAALYEEVLPMRRQAGDRAGEAYTYYGIAAANWSLGEAAAALDAYRKALAIWQDLRSLANQAHTHNSMGLIFAMLGDYGRAKAGFEQALALWQKEGDKTSPLLAWNNWCLASVGERQYAAAIPRCQTAIDLARASGDFQGMAYAAHNMANAYAGLKMPEKAMPLYELSLSSKRESGDRWGEAATLHAIGEMLLETRDPGAADLLERALALRRETGDRAGQAQSLGALARLYGSQGDLSRSLGAIEEAIGLIEAQRAKLASQDLRASYLASVRDFYELHVDLLMRSGRPGPALEAAMRARGRSLADRLADTLGGIRKGVDPKLLDRQRAAGRRLDAQAELLRQAASPREHAAVRRRIDALLSEYRDAAEQIRVASPKYAALAQPEALSVAELQEVLDRGDVLLQYFPGKVRSFLWVVTRKDLAVHTLPGRSRIEADVRTLLSAVTARGDVTAAAARAARTLLEPAGGALLSPGVRRVVIAADGEIESVPFAALPAGDRPLAARAEIAYLPSAAALRLFRAEGPRRAAPSRQIALFADPVYSSDARGAARTANGPDLPRLRFSRLEAEAIAKLTPAPSRLLVLDQDASRQTTERARLGDFRIIHFATHSLLDSRPELSGIALSDGLLRLHEIYNLDLRARLVTLSSCRSAVGGALQGDGLASIARGFLYAGAAAVAGTLWDIDDRATSELMKHFYEALLLRQWPPAAALRAAQLAIRARPGWEHPYYWAGFVLHGEWR